MAEQVVMTPKFRTENSTAIIIERTQKLDNGTAEDVHVAGGEHTGIVINKQVADKKENDTTPAQLSLEFRVYLVDSQTGKHVPESRILQFWFRSLDDESNNEDEASVAQNFFRELVNPSDFPRNYVGYIMKIMKLMQMKYQRIKKLEVELTRMKDVPIPVSITEQDLKQKAQLTSDRVLEIIESAYPNPITAKDVAINGWSENDVMEHLTELQSKGLVKTVDSGAFTRQQSCDTDVKIVEKMPQMVNDQQPTIAIITAQYCEKLAVDAMIDNKETFVRYTTIGESNVYTLGNIGPHRVVCTKLPSVGHTREAMTAAGSTTTRLLGTFQKVEYVFLVGLGGGVPHYTDYNKHVRLGDVVVSYPTTNDKGVYLYCESATPNNNKNCNFEIKAYKPVNPILQQITRDLVQNCVEPSDAPWMRHLNEGLRVLRAQSDATINVPNIDTDKLYMSIGETDIIEVSHPAPLDKNKLRPEGCPRVHLSPIASGRLIVKDDYLRQMFASEVSALAFDCEYDAVIESIIGNCKDSFVCVRGISDYRDGTKRKDWQPYASLAAAAVAKAIICSLEG